MNDLIYSVNKKQDNLFTEKSLQTDRVNLPKKSSNSERQTNSDCSKLFVSIYVFF